MYRASLLFMGLICVAPAHAGDAVFAARVPSGASIDEALAPYAPVKVHYRVDDPRTSTVVFVAEDRAAGGPVIRLVPLGQQGVSLYRVRLRPTYAAPRTHEDRPSNAVISEVRVQVQGMLDHVFTMFEPAQPNPDFPKPVVLERAIRLETDYANTAGGVQAECMVLFVAATWLRPFDVAPAELQHLAALTPAEAPPADPAQAGRPASTQRGFVDALPGQD